jgi:hypothetical protein
VDIFRPDMPREAATKLHARLKDFQNEHKDMKWAPVRLIRNKNLFLVEGGFGLCLWYGKLPSEGYRLAADYCEHYGARYGNGLNGPSVHRIEEIAGFVRAMEAHEVAGSTPSVQEA